MDRAATPEEQRAIAAAVQKGMEEGGLGLGLGLAYTPSASHQEILDLFYLAATWKRPVFVHLRDAGAATPGIIESLQEVIGNAAASGVALHIVHINSMAQKKTPEALRMIEGARARGLDVTTEAYPTSRDRHTWSRQFSNRAGERNWEQTIPTCCGSLPASVLRRSLLSATGRWEDGW
jgi:N-acyl-D-aspartate/D-glutamate deacylase